VRLDAALPVELDAEPALAPADRERNRERWAAARELSARWR
jgi:hypothetical protein